MASGETPRLERWDTRIKPTSTTRIPRRHIVWDTEAHSTYENGVTMQTWALGAYAVLDYEARNSTPTGTVECVDTPLDLWVAVTNLCRPGTRTVMWAHNLGYDLRISRALLELPMQGWVLVGAVLERQAAWCSWRRDGATLLMCDLFSWLPVPLSEIAKDLGTQKRKLDPNKLAERCAQDVTITARAVHEILTYLWGEQLGSFRPTGPGMAYSAWRAKYLTHKVVSHGDTSIIEIERRAMWTGRCEVWKWGSDNNSPAWEYDVQAAYAHIGAECNVPTQYLGPVSIRDAQRAVSLADGHGILCRAHVTTRVPCVPCELNGRIVWPVGEFETVLWDPELRLAVEQCSNVTILGAWLYTQAPALATACADWLRILKHECTICHAITVRLVKSWSRSLIGRLALKYREWEPIGDAPGIDAAIFNTYDRDEDRQLTHMHIGSSLFELSDMHEGYASLPMITGYVMSEARVRLWTLMRLAGLENVRYVDTDSIFCTANGASRLSAAITSGNAYSLRLKKLHGRVQVNGERHVIVDDGRRLSGVPNKATQTGPRSYRGEIWRGIADSMHRGQPDSVAIMPRDYNIKAGNPRRVHAPHHHTLPHRIGV